MLLDRAHREAFKAESSIERLTDECHGLRGDFQRQETLVVQRDGAIASLRDEVCNQWVSGWLAFQRRVANAYPGLDLNFDIPRDKEAEESFSANCSGELVTPAEARSPSSPSALNPAPDALASLYNFVWFFFFTLGSEPQIYVMPFLALKLNEYPIFYLLSFFPNCVPYVALPKLTLICGYMAFSSS